MGLTQLRFETRSRSAITGALAEHVSGKTRPETALARDAWDGRSALELYQLDRDSALSIVDKARELKRRGRPGAEAVEILMGGPPPLDSPEAWSPKKLMAWADDSVSWVKKRWASPASWCRPICTWTKGRHISTWSSSRWSRTPRARRSLGGEFVHARPASVMTRPAARMLGGKRQGCRTRTRWRSAVDTALSVVVPAPRTFTSRPTGRKASWTGWRTKSVL